MSQSRLTNEVWIWGATGRVGRAVAARLVGCNIEPVLVGRDRERLSKLAASLDKELRIIVAGSPEESATEMLFALNPARKNSVFVVRERVITS